MKKIIQYLFVLPLFFVFATQTFAADSSYVNGTTEAPCISVSRLLALDLSGTGGCGVPYWEDPTVFYAGDFDISSIPSGMDLKTVTVKFWVNNVNEDSSVHYTPTLIVDGTCSVVGDVIEPTYIHWEEITRRFDISSCGLTSSTDSIQKVQITRNNTSGGGAIDYIALKVSYEISTTQTYDLSDRSTFGLDLTNHGATSVSANLATSDSDWATDFESSSSQYLTAPDDNSLNQSNILIESWVKFESLPSSGNAMSIVEKLNAFGFNLWNDSGTYKLRITRGSNSATTTWTPTVGVWYHLGVGFDPDGTPNVKFFVNGSQQGSTINTSLGGAIDNANLLYIGAKESGGSATNFMDGQLDEIRIWNYDRSNTQINDNYNVELYGFVNPLSAYYPFESF